MTQALATIDRASELFKTVNELVDLISEEELLRSQRFVRLGRALTEIEVNQFWKNLGFVSWNQYLSSLHDRVQRGRTALYGYVSVCKALLPVVGEENLEKMGINKAAVLKGAMKFTGRQSLSDDIVRRAVDDNVTAEQLQEAVEKEFKLFFPNEKGRFHSLSLFCTNSEWESITAGINLAMRYPDPVDPEASDKAKLKEALLHLSMEFQSTWLPIEAEGKKQ